MHLARIGADVVVHPNGGVARAAIAVQNDAHIVGKLVVLAVERVVQHGRRDLVAEEHFFVDVAVQLEFSQGTSLPFICAAVMGTMLPLTMYAPPPAPSGSGFMFSSSRMSSADSQPFWRPMA